MRKEQRWPFNRVTLDRNGYSLVWTTGQGVYLPHWIASPLVSVVNRITCAIWGHDCCLFHAYHHPEAHGYVAESVCPNCSIRLTRCTKHGADESSSGEAGS